MPMMTLASTAIDQIQVNRDTTIANCIAYLPTDSALFLTHDMDRLLLLKQKTHYAPVVRWLNRLLNIDLTSTQNMSARIAHCKVAAHKLRLVLESMVRCFRDILTHCCGISSVVFSSIKPPFRTISPWLVFRVPHTSASHWSWR